MSNSSELSLNNIRAALADLPLGDVHYHPVVASTNATAAALSSRGAPDLTVVVADEQTAGRGRKGRTWITRPEAALAVSVILRPDPERVGPRAGEAAGRYSGLGGLAAVEALRDLYRLPAQVKWPNDILVHGLKVGGVLVETGWEGESLTEIVMGIGLNVLKTALPEGVEFRYPAGTIQEAAGDEVRRLAVLRGLLEYLLLWRARMGSGSFLHAWERALAFRGQQVTLNRGEAEQVEGILVGLTESGALKLQTGKRQIEEFPVGEIQLRPVDRS